VLRVQPVLVATPDDEQPYRAYDTGATLRLNLLSQTKDYESVRAFVAETDEEAAELTETLQHHQSR
jgi:hypothetical protein